MLGNLPAETFTILARQLASDDLAALSFARLEMASPLLRSMVRQTLPTLRLEVSYLARATLRQHKWMQRGWGGSLATVLQRYPAAQEVKLICTGAVPSGGLIDWQPQGISAAFEAFVSVYNDPDAPEFVCDLVPAGESYSKGCPRIKKFAAEKGARLAEVGARRALCACLLARPVPALTGTILRQKFTNKAHYFDIQLRTSAGSIFEFDCRLGGAGFDEVEMMEVYEDETGDDSLWDCDDPFGHQGFQAFLQKREEQKRTRLEGMVKSNPLSFVQQECLPHLSRSVNTYARPDIRTVKITERGTDFDEELRYIGDPSQSKPSQSQPSKKRKNDTTAAPAKNICQYGQQ